MLIKMNSTDTRGSARAAALLAAVATLAWAGVATAQTAPQGEAFTGPTKQALSATARSLLVRDIPPPPHVLPRYIAFERRFDADFGVAGTRPLQRGEILQHVEGEIAARWGETQFYRWLRRGVALYAQFDAWTEMERRGFDVEVEVDDVGQGKLGLKVARTLE